MNLPRWGASNGGLTVEDTGVLARSPLYPRWRAEVAKVFARIDDGTAAAVKPHPRLLICVLPAGLPLSSQKLWPELEPRGAWAALDKPFGAHLAALVKALAARPPAPGLELLESTWAIEVEPRLAALADTTSLTALSWRATAAARREFLNRLNAVSRDLRSVDQTTADLRRVDLSHLLPAALTAQPRIREFLRAVLLSGNGSLVFPNSFVQWGASEALRRVQPQAFVACFGMRAKLKPFSSMVLFEDQQRSNPTPDEDDPAGSLIDALLLSQYVYLSAQRQSAYQGRTLTLLAASDLDRVLLLGPKAPAHFAADELTRFALAWLASV